MRPYLCVSAVNFKTALTALIYWLLRPAVWRTWLAYLYGVDTWDLRLIVRLCRRLGMRESARVGSGDRPGLAGPAGSSGLRGDVMA